MITAPDQTGGPATVPERPVVINRCRRASSRPRLKRFRIPQQPVADLHRPIAIRREREAHRTRVPPVCFEVIAILVRLMAIEYRSLDLQPTIGEASREHAKTNMR